MGQGPAGWRSGIPLRDWAVAIFVSATKSSCTTNLNGIQSAKLHRELGITHQCAGSVAQLLRCVLDQYPHAFGGPVIADDSCMHSKRHNMQNAMH